MNTPRLYLLFTLATISLTGCRPDPVYVLERVDGGEWVRSLSVDVARDSLVWRIEHELDERYRASVEGLRASALEELREEQPDLFVAFTDAVDLTSPLIESDLLPELVKIASTLDRFAIPVDGWLRKRMETDHDPSDLRPEPGLRPKDRERLRELVTSEPEVPVVSLNEVVEQESDVTGVLWMERYLGTLEFDKRAVKGRVETEIRSVLAIFRALEIVGRKPASNEFVDSKYVPETVPISPPLTLVSFVGELRGLEGDSPEPLFRNYLPVHQQFERLSKAFLTYQQIVQDGGWEKLNFRTVLKKGARGEKVIALRQRLAKEGFSVEVAPEEESVFGVVLQRALRAYQRQHFLGIHGKLDQKTRRVLNRSAEERLVEIGLTMWKWSTSRLEDVEQDHLFINVPTFQGALWRGGEAVHQFKVAVGKSRRRKTQKRGWHYPNATPSLMSKIRHVVMEPRWNIPSRIFKKEILPEVEKDPTYAEKKHYVLDGEPGAYRGAYQTSGPWNALGRVKFVFPNEESVYLHDTPGKRVFKRSYRAASHGCVRVENALELAKLLLEPERRWREKYEEAPETPTERWIGLKKPMPVFLESYRVWVGDNGEVAFGSDLYRQEKGLMTAFNQLWEAELARAAKMVVEPGARP